MFDIEPFIVDNCDDCGTRHAPIRGCPIPPKILFTDSDIQDCYNWFVVNHYMGATGEAISLQDFLGVWEDMNDFERMKMLSDSQK